MARSSYKSSSILYRKIKEKLSKSYTTDSYVKIEERIAGSFNTSYHSIRDMFGALPETLVAWSFKDGDPTGWLTLPADSNVVGPSGCEGLLLCHSLNPTWETVALLSELGRACRVAHSLDLPLKIMLADQTWSRYNWVVKDLELEKNLENNYLWRKDLYKRLLRSFDYIQDIDTDRLLTTCGENDSSDILDEIRFLSREYADFCEHIWGTQFVSKRLEEEDLKLIDETSMVQMVGTNNTHIDYKRFKFLREEILPHEETIVTVAKN